MNRFSGAANALLFDFEPFVNAAARPRQLYRHGDWSTALQVSPTVRVTGQQFLGTSNGLGSASTRDFGAPVSGVRTGLVNQYLPSVSIFSGRSALGQLDGEIGIAPASGHYGEAQFVTLSTNGTGIWRVFYRIGARQAWVTYAGSFTVISDAVVEAYGRRVSDGALTPVARATYTFSEPAGKLDSDNDGVPDFVEKTRGLNPLLGADSDHDGFTDLEELARGSDPLSSASKPNVSGPMRNAFNRLVSPQPPHPTTGAPAKPATNVTLRAFSLGGSFLGTATTSPIHGGGDIDPAALFVNLSPEPRARFIVETTPNHYGLAGNFRLRAGRELIGLVPVPPTNQFLVNYSYGGGSLATETANWIVAASNAVKTAENPTNAGLLTHESALVAALFERHAADALLARGTNGAGHATLFDFRSGDADRLAITAADISNLEQYSGPGAPGYSQQTVFEFLDREVRSPKSSALSDFAKELWRISAAESNAEQGTYPLPFDEVRRLLSGEPITPSYLPFKSLSTNELAARAQAAKLLALVPPRPQTNITAVVVANHSGPEPIRLQTLDGRAIALWRFDGAPFVFPPNLQLLPGARIALFAHSDLPSSQGELALEVIWVAMTAVPMPSPGDADGNLLVDSWEELFFGHIGVDPFADADGDGYSNFQEMLEGTQPDDALVKPGVPPNGLERPLLVLNTEGGQLNFRFTWPASFIDQFQFGLQASDQVEGPYVQTSTPPLSPVGGGAYELQLPRTLDPLRFYRLTLQLRR
jgi:hypothetical protein